jgi:hypothetical protein
MDEAVRHRIAALCDQLSRWPSLETLIRDGGAEAELKDLLRLLVGRTDPDQGQVIALIDAVERGCARQGLAGLTNRGGRLPSGYTALPSVSYAGLPTGTSETAGWTCPLGRCSRVVIPDESAVAPDCAAGPDGGMQMKPYTSRPR